jgi:type VII secretion integral membrane protein EccD
MPAASTGLARVTISSPQRRVDVALPDGVPLAELLAEVLQHAGVGLADDGQRHGGWLLRRADGTALSPATGLANQGVRDGAVLHLVPARVRWPEPEYDDVVEAIAASARRYGLGWSAAATRATALAAAGLVLAVALVAVVRAGSAPVGLVIAAALLTGGTAASRAYGDAVVGAALAGYGLPFAFAGGMLLGGADGRLTGSAVGVLASALGGLGVAHGLRLFVAGGTAGVLGVLGALLTIVTTTAGAAAALLALLVTGVAAVPLLAIRLGRLPMPVLSPPSEAGRSETGSREAGRSETGPGEAGQRPPGRALVFAAVVRTDEMLTGMLIGFALAASVAFWVLAKSGDPSGRVLVGVAAVALLLRARLFVTVRQRLPLLGAGLAGFALLALALVGPGAAPPNAVLAVVLVGAALVVAIGGARYATRTPSPYLGRAADIVDTLCVVSVVPVACAVLGFYGLARGIAG